VNSTAVSIVLRGHEDRLLSVEGEVAGLAARVEPALAGLTVEVKALVSEVRELCDALKTHQEDSEKIERTVSGLGHVAASVRRRRHVTAKILIAAAIAAIGTAVTLGVRAVAKAFGTLPPTM